MDTETALALITPGSNVILTGIGIVTVMAASAPIYIKEAIEKHIIATFTMVDNDNTGYLVDMDKHGVMTVIYTDKE